MDNETKKPLITASELRAISEQVSPEEDRFKLVIGTLKTAASTGARMAKVSREEIALLDLEKLVPTPDPNSTNNNEDCFTINVTPDHIYFYW